MGGRGAAGPCGHHGRMSTSAFPLITKDDVHRFTSRAYRKVAATWISDDVLAPGTRVETLEGEYVCSEPSRLATDVAGNVYPIAESVLAASYEPIEPD